MNTNSHSTIAKRNTKFRSRRRGISLVLFALCMPVIFGCLAIVIDMGTLYTIRARTQRAADAAALAGAIVSSGSNQAVVVAKAQEYCGYNDFPVGDSSVTITVQTGSKAGAVSTQTINNVRVVVTKRARVYFAPVLEGLLKGLGANTGQIPLSRDVSSEATAEKVGDFSLNVPGFYGIADPSKAPANLSVFGPYSNHQWGDPYSVLYNEDGTVNKSYDPKGYQYDISVSPKFSSTDGKLYIQIYDPDSYRPGSKNSWDEGHDPNPNNPTQSPTGAKDTRTQYDLYADDGTVDGKFITSASYAADPTTNEQWVTPLGFDVDPKAYGGKFKLRVHSTDGASENGFLLRAGPQEGLKLSDVEWNKKYGDNNNTDPGNIAAPIQANGSLQMNFTQSGTVKFALGYVSSDYAGRQITINKFDVDVGSQSITYTNTGLPGQKFTGTFPSTRNDTWAPDNLTLPANYPGGTWYVEYVAGAGDTSNWKLSGADSGSGEVYLSK